GGAGARANRTLFLGNLDITVSESDLRRAFDRFGVITEVDIKRPGRGQTSTYGFLKFENLDMAHRAKLAMSGKVLLRNPIKIGYGKALLFCSQPYLLLHAAPPACARCYGIPP
uniref:RRM domain-containing protein n=1 Tax=Cyanistes caeruleus TaxID=156563 RepID=A0A8C0U6T4_CYACU